MQLWAGTKDAVLVAAVMQERPQQVLLQCHQAKVPCAGVFTMQV
jgi:hypothetical protein